MKDQNQKVYRMPTGALLVIFAGCISLMNVILFHFTMVRPGFRLIGLPGKITLIAMLLHAIKSVGMIGLGIQLGMDKKGKGLVVVNALLSLVSVAFVVFLRTPAAMAARMFLEHDYWLKINVAIGLGAGTSLLYMVLMLVFSVNAFLVNAKSDGSKVLDVLIASAVMLLSSLWSCFSESLLGIQFAHVAAYVLLSLGLYLCALSRSKDKWMLKSAAPYTVKSYLRMVLALLPLGAAVVLIALEKVGIALILLAIPVVYAVIGLKKDGAALTANNQKIAFYNECIAGGITECKSEKDIQRATLIAQKQNLKFTDIAAFYGEAKVLAELDMQNKRHAEEETIRNKERSQYEEWNRYSALQGREKRIAMLTDARKDALETAKRISSGMNATISATQQKEHDWATHGGIASGIAGPVAGAVVALDVQAKNAKIREQNKANIRAMAPVVLESMKEEGYYRMKAKELEQQIEETKTKLVGNLDTPSCFENIVFSDVRVDVSETGTCKIGAFGKLKNKLVIFDDVEAVVDGVLLAKVFDGDQLIGTATVVIPCAGIGGSTYLKGMCLFCAEAGKNYTVEFVPENLWAMEC